MTKHFIPALAHRMAEVAIPADQETREIEISFSSETPYKRRDYDAKTDYWEVLGHTGDEVDLSRLNSGSAPLLKDHMPILDSHIGVVVRAWIADGKGKALVRFSNTPSADDVLTRVRDGDVTCVSVGYQITQAIRDGQQDGHTILRVTGWAPKEISFVAIPADPTVGYGRADQGNAPTIEITDPKIEQKGADMPDDVKTPAQPKAPNADQVRSDPAISADDILNAERKRVGDIDAIATKFDLPVAVVNKAKNTGMSVDAVREMALDHLSSDEVAATRAGETKIGLSGKEVQAFSMMNLVRFLSNPTERNREGAAFELEASRAVGDVLGREAGGAFIPEDVLLDGNYARANTLTPSAGGVLVPTQYASGSFIDLLRNRMALTGVGVRILQGLTGNVDIPKQTGAGTMYWIDEDEDVTDSDVSFGLVPLTPHGAGMAIPFTRRMAQQGSPDIEALIRSDLLSGMALGIDKTALSGHTSAKAPDGLRDKILADADDWVGQFPTFEEIVALETAVAAENADVGSMAYIYNAKMTGALKTSLTFPDAPTGEPIDKDNMVNSYNRVRTNQVADGEAFFGNWSDLIIGQWSGLDLRVDTSTKAASDGKVLRVFTDLDVAVRNTESFKMGKRA